VHFLFNQLGRKEEDFVFDHPICSALRGVRLDGRLCDDDVTFVHHLGEGVEELQYYTKYGISTRQGEREGVKCILG
jgi:hypothetical protein